VRRKKQLPTTIDAPADDHRVNVLFRRGSWPFERECRLRSAGLITALNLRAVPGYSYRREKSPTGAGSDGPRGAAGTGRKRSSCWQPCCDDRVRSPATVLLSTSVGFPLRHGVWGYEAVPFNAYRAAIDPGETPDAHLSFRRPRRECLATALLMVQTAPRRDRRGRFKRRPLSRS
jgi:hypothetical protein